MPILAYAKSPERRERAFQRQVDLRDRGVGTEALVEDAELSAASARQAVLSSRNALAQALPERAGGGWAKLCMDVLTGTRQVEATVPGAGSVILNSSPLPGELVETCRAPDQAVTAEAAESDPSPAPAAPEDPA